MSIFFSCSAGSINGAGPLSSSSSTSAFTFPLSIELIPESISCVGNYYIAVGVLNTDDVSIAPGDINISPALYLLPFSVLFGPCRVKLFIIRSLSFSGDSASAELTSESIKCTIVGGELFDTFLPDLLSSSVFISSIRSYLYEVESSS